MRYKEKFYNAEQKIRFIEERNKEVVVPTYFLERQFAKIADKEKMLDKDVCNWNYYDIIEYYKMLNCTSAHVLAVLHSHLSFYVTWCVQQNLVTDNQNHFLEIVFSDFSQCINKALIGLKIISKSTLYKWVDELPNPRDQFILLGIFEGIKGKDFCEFVNLRPEDVEGNTFHLATGRTLEVSDKLVNLIDKCKEEKYYYPMTDNEDLKFVFVNDGYVLKNYPNCDKNATPFIKGRRIYNTLLRIFKYFGVYPLLTANSIVDSGKIDLLNTLSEEKGISFLNETNPEILKEFALEIEQKFNCTFNRKSFIMKYGDYLK